MPTKQLKQLSKPYYFYYVCPQLPILPLLPPLPLSIKVLVVVGDTEGFDQKDPVYLSVRNIPTVRFRQQKQLNVADLLWPHQIIMSEKALEGIVGRYTA